MYMHIYCFQPVLYLVFVFICKNVLLFFNFITACIFDLNKFDMCI